MKLFRISSELQFGFYCHGEPPASSHSARETEQFYTGENEGGWLQKTRVQCFSSAESLPGKESVFFLLDSAVVAGHERFPCWGLDSIWMRLLFINFFTFFPFDEGLNLKASWVRVRFSSVRGFFVIQCQDRPFCPECLLWKSEWSYWETNKAIFK